MVERVNAALPRGGRPYTQARLVRTLRLLAAEGLADKNLPAPAPRGHTRRGGLARKRAVEVAAALVSSRPGRSLAEVGAELARLRHYPPQGGTAWAPSSVKALLARARARARARAQGLLLPTPPESTAVEARTRSERA